MILTAFFLAKTQAIFMLKILSNELAYSESHNNEKKKHLDKISAFITFKSLKQKSYPYVFIHPYEFSVKMVNMIRVKL